MKLTAVSLFALVLSPTLMRDCLGGDPADPVTYDVGFRVLDIEVDRTGPESTLITSGAQFAAAFGSPAPSTIDFATETVLFYSLGPVPLASATLTPTAFTVVDNELEMELEIEQAGSNCTVMEYSRPVGVVVVLEDALAGVDTLIDESTTVDYDCATSGNTAGDECGLLNLCEPGHICAGLTRADTGFCVTDDAWGTWEDLYWTSIPDAGTASDTLVVSGLQSVDTDVVVWVKLGHDRPSDLHITLTNPDGNTVVVWNRESSGPDPVIERVPTGFSGDESVNGSWTLDVADQVSGEWGSVQAWGLEIVSRWD